MKERKSLSGVIAAIITLVVVLAIFNVCTFLIPFKKMDETVHYVIYGCASFVIIAQMLLIIFELFLEGDSNQKILSLPIIYFGYITLVIQLVATIIFYVCNAFVAMPLWIVILVECLIVGIGVAEISLGFFFKDRNQNYHERLSNTKFMDEFRCRLKALCKINTNSNVEKPLNDLLEIALGSDPVTNEKTLDSESELLSLLQDLDESIKEGSEEETRIVIDRTRNTLIERNVLCKAGK